MSWLSTGRPAISASSFAIILLLMALAIGTLVPFTPPSSWPDPPSSLLEVLSIPWSPFDGHPIIEHILPFWMLGVVLHWTLLSRRVRRPILTSLAGVLLITFILEIGQNLGASRHARMCDVAFRVFGGLIGVACCQRLRVYRDGLRQLYARYDRGLALVGIVLGNIVATGVVIRSHTAVTLDGWDCHDPLLVANEATADRPWHGRVAGLAMYDEALSARQVAKLANQPFTATASDARRQLHPMLLYSFDGHLKRRVSQRSDDGPPLDLLLPPPGPDTWQQRDGALDITGDITVRSDGEVGATCRAVQSSRAFTLELAAESANPTQHGPARILSISKNPYERNVTIGQEYAEFIVRIATPRTGTNGLLIPIRTHGHAVDGRWHHIALTYRNGLVRFYLDGQDARPPLRLFAASTMLFRRDFLGGGFLAAMVLFWPIGVCGAILFLCQRDTTAHCLAALATCSVPLVASLLSALRWERTIDFEFTAAIILAALMGSWLGRRMHPAAAKTSTGGESTNTARAPRE